MLGRQALFVVCAWAFIPHVLQAGISASTSEKSLGAAEVPANYIPRMKLFPDGSISWNQPDNINLGYDGYCGHVAWSNAVTMYSGKKFDPSFFKYFSKGDLTPGLRPATLTSALNAATNEYGVHWRWYRFQKQNAWQRLKAALNQKYFGVDATPLPATGLKYAPVIVVIQNGKLQFHWITVVGYYDAPQPSKSYVIANDNGTQTLISYQWFMEAWSFTEANSLLSTLINNIPGFGNFSAILPSSL